jgi:hypothetical protein
MTGFNRFNAVDGRGNFARPNAAMAGGRFGTGPTPTGADPRSMIANNQFVFRAGNFHNRWDPGRSYYWNNCQWRCFNGVWAVVGIGWPYDWYSYPYPFWYDNCVYYDGDAYQPGSPYTQPAAIGGGSSLVSNVQQDLAKQGYNPGPADGVLGPQTSDSIAEYQGDHGMTPTGRIDGALLDSLGL